MKAETTYGAARERTGLAWRRTSLAFALNGVLLVRSSEPWLEVAALLVLAFATAIAAFSASAFRDPRTPGWLSGRRRDEILAIAAAVVGILDLVAIASGG
jgi:Domain of unknown function (DUF202)